MSKRGGKRAGAGRKFGSYEKKTIEEKEALNHLRERILKEYDPIIDSMMAAAKGYYYQKGGVAPVGEPANPIYTTHPNHQVAKQLLEFVVGKAPQTINNNISDPGGQRSIDALAETVKTILSPNRPKQTAPKPKPAPVKAEEPKPEPIVSIAPTDVNPVNILKP